MTAPTVNEKSGGLGSGFVAICVWDDVNSRFVPVQGSATGAIAAAPFGASSTGAITSVADTATSTTLLAANVNRKAATIFNDSTEVLYVALAAVTASTTVYTVRMALGAYYEVPGGYTGIINGIWAADAAGSARITELT